MDISTAVFDPEPGCTAFTVERITYTRSRAGPAEDREQKSRGGLCDVCVRDLLCCGVCQDGYG